MSRFYCTVLGLTMYKATVTALNSTVFSFLKKRKQSDVLMNHHALESRAKIRLRVIFTVNNVDITGKCLSYETCIPNKQTDRLMDKKQPFAQAQTKQIISYFISS